jgi:hypothetical protein
MEWWSDGFETQYSNIPLLQHSILFARLASEIFLSSLQSGFFSNLLISNSVPGILLDGPC